MKNLFIFGAGGHACSVASIAISLNYKIIAFIDENSLHSTLLDIPVISQKEFLSRYKNEYFFIASGDNFVREKLVIKYKKILKNVKFPCLIHPSSVISHRCIIGEGSIVMPNVTIGPNSVVGKFCIINTNSSIDHDCNLNDFSSIAPGVVAGGNVKIGQGSAISIGAVIKHGITIAGDVVVGAASYVNKNIYDPIVSYGTPAKMIRKRKKGDLYLGEEESGSTKILFFGRDDCYYTIQAYELLNKLNFDVTFIKSYKLGESIPVEASNWQGDYIICFRSFYIITKELLSKAKIASINFHPGPTEYPGSGCINFALYEEANEYGVTVHLMNEKIDNGKIIECIRFPIFKKDTVDALLKRTHKKLLKLFVSTIKGIKREKENYIKNKLIHSKNEQWNGLARKMSELNSLQSVTTDVNEEKLKKVIRATYTENHPTTTFIHGYKFVLKK